MEGTPKEVGAGRRVEVSHFRSNLALIAFHAPLQNPKHSKKNMHPHIGLVVKIQLERILIAWMT